MPIYEYNCSACGQDIEVIQKMSDAPLKKCPECGKNKLIKLVSAAGFKLTGTGWYETDFKGNNKKPEAPSKTIEKSTEKPIKKSTKKPAEKKSSAGCAHGGSGCGSKKTA